MENRENMRKAFLISLMLFFSLASTSCSTLATSHAEILTPTAVIKITETLMPDSLSEKKATTTNPLPSQITPSKTVEPVHPTGTPEPVTATPEIPILPTDSLMQVTCLQVKPSLPEHIHGIIPLQPLEGSAYYLNLRTGKKVSAVTENQSAVDFTTSPDGNWAAYTLIEGHAESATKKLVISWPNGTAFRIYPYQKEWAQYFWLNNKQLLIYLPSSNSGESAGDFLLLDPFTQKEQVLKSDFPDILAANWGNDGSSVYSPLGNRVIYPQGGSPIGYSIMNLKTNRIIANISSEDVQNYSPVWSSDGTLFVITLNYGTYHRGAVLYYQDGREIGPIDPMGYLKSYKFSNYAWSPDNSSFVFSLGKSVSEPYGLAMFNFAGVTINIFCMPETGVKFWQRQVHWAPDSQSLIFEDWSDNQFQANRIILVNLKDNSAYEIAENARLGGWMNDTGQ